jgi:hypothetical protein
MADEGFEYEWTGSGKVWFGVQSVSGATAEAEPGGRIVLAEPVAVEGLRPVNDAAKHAAELHGEATDVPLAGRVGDMKVAEVLPLLDELGPAELAEVRDAEAAGKARATLLDRIDELAAPPGEAATEGESH